MIVGNIYQFRKDLSVIYAVVFFLSILCFSIVLILNNGNNTLLSKFLFAFIFIFSFVVPFFFNPIRIVGKITFTDKEITVKSPSLCKIFKVNDINKITLLYYGYKGQSKFSLSAPLAFSNGDGNEVILNHLGIEFKFIFQIVDENFIGQLIKQWKSLSKPKIRIYRKNKKIIWTNYK